MRMPPAHIESRRASQRGATLIVALVLLLVMTIIGIAAVQSSILQGFMSSSQTQQTRVLAASENVLLSGEWEVEDIVWQGVQNKPGRLDYYINLDNDPSAEFPASEIGANWPNPVVIEYMGEFLIPGESAAMGGGLEDSFIHIFRVSARETRPEEERGGERIVQSLYVTLVAPDE